MKAQNKQTDESKNAGDLVSNPRSRVAEHLDRTWITDHKLMKQGPNTKKNGEKWALSGSRPKTARHHPYRGDGLG